MDTTGFSTSTTDVNAASIPRRKHRLGRKAQPRVTDGVRHPVTVRKVEPIIARERTVSAARAESVARLGYLPSLGSA